MRAMADDRPIVIRADEAAPPPGPPTPGMDRRQLFVGDGYWVGWLRTEPGLEGGWHHHGEHDSVIYVLRGSIHIDFGPGGRERVTARSGDAIFNPKRLIHREVTPAGDPTDAFVVRVGSGPQNFNVDGPDPD
jgi:uncharacterized RmlC-like cupin family protein